MAGPWYVDTDAGTDGGGTGLTWAAADLTFEYALETRASAGETIYIQGAAADNYGAAVTFTSPGTIVSPIVVIGCADGTTNEGDSIVAADIATRGTDTLPKISTGVGAYNISFGGIAHVTGVHFDSDNWNQLSANDALWEFVGCEIEQDGSYLYLDKSAYKFTDCELIMDGSVILHRGAASQWLMHGGVLTYTSAPSTLIAVAPIAGHVDYIGVDLTGLAASATLVAAGVGKYHFKNCKMNALWSLGSGVAVNPNFFAEAIGCDNTSSIAANATIQDYESYSAYGSVDLETTVLRTGGADDGAAGGGAYSYALTPHASSTLESSSATLKSPWLRVWATGAASTFTVYIVHNDTDGDERLMYEDEIFCEFYTPAETDSAMHDQTFDSALPRFSSAATAITSDSSAWVSVNTYKGKFEVTKTTGHEGWIYAQVHIAKRHATPNTVYLDPQIHVT